MEAGRKVNEEERERASTNVVGDRGYAEKMQRKKKKCQGWGWVGGIRAKRGGGRTSERAERKRDEGMSKTDIREEEQVRGEERRRKERRRCNIQTVCCVFHTCVRSRAS